MTITIRDALLLRLPDAIPGRCSPMKSATRRCSPLQAAT